MPLYDFQCTRCGLEFEVSRTFSESSDSADCPLDSAPAKRVYNSAPTTFVKSRGGPPPLPSAAPSGGRWSHGGHSHGPGTGGHTH